MWVCKRGHVLWTFLLPEGRRKVVGALSWAQWVPCSWKCRLFQTPACPVCDTCFIYYGSAWCCFFLEGTKKGKHGEQNLTGKVSWSIKSSCLGRHSAMSQEETIEYKMWKVFKIQTASVKTDAWKFRERLKEMRYDPVILLQRVSVLRYDCISKVQSQRIIPSAAVFTRSFWSPIMHIKSMKPTVWVHDKLICPRRRQIRSKNVSKQFVLIINTASSI